MAAALPPDGGRDLALVVSGDCDPADVLSRLRGWLEPAQVPVRCRLVGELPTTTNGKVDRARLADLLEER